MSPRALTPAEARQVYDHIGHSQDTQAFYEDPAVRSLIANAHLHGVSCVLEVGCGTGRWAQRLLERHLPGDARYIGLDLSPVMLDLAHRRLAPFGDRAFVARSDITRGLPLADRSVDRVVVTYVADLLSWESIAALVDDVHRVLVPGGLLCNAGLTRGETPVSRIVTAVWSGLFRLSPRIVGGCRPIQLLPCLGGGRWHVLHHSVVTSWGVPSEVVVAEAS